MFRRLTMSIFRLYSITLFYFNLVLSIYPYYYSLILLPLPTLVCIRPLLVSLCEIEQINYGVFNLIYKIY